MKRATPCEHLYEFRFDEVNPQPYYHVSRLCRRETRMRLYNLEKERPMRLKKWFIDSVVILFALIIAIAGVCGW
jgi:hypothetical protein